MTPLTYTPQNTPEILESLRLPSPYNVIFSKITPFVNRFKIDSYNGWQCSIEKATSGVYQIYFTNIATDAMFAFSVFFNEDKTKLYFGLLSRENLPATLRNELEAEFSYAPLHLSK